jgi:hypothetical protein
MPTNKLQSNHAADNIKTIVKVFHFLSAHYVLVTFIVMLFVTLICYCWATAQYEFYNIPYWQYADISDIYSNILKDGGAGIGNRIIIFTTLFSSVLVVILVVVSFQGSQSKYKQAVVEGVVGCYIIFIFFSPKLITYLSSTLFAYEQSNYLPARVNAYLRFEEEPFNCVSIIGGTTDYMFLWDHDNAQPIAVARANVTTIITVIGKLPYSRDEGYPKKREAWVSELAQKCGQVPREI